MPVAVVNCAKRLNQFVHLMLFVPLSVSIIIGAGGHNVADAVAIIESILLLLEFILKVVPYVMSLYI
jgi:hypothetical protein